MAEFERDMFGHLIDPRRGAIGRPRHFATPDLRAEVKAMRSGGHTLPEIATAIGISVPTLQLHYPRELGSRSQAWRRHADHLPTDGEDHEH